MKKTVFFYGLFMDKDLLIQKGLNPGNVTLACVPNFKLIIGQRASLLPCGGVCAYGTTMLLNDNELASLYNGNGVEDYQPHPVQIKDSQDQATQVITYLLPANKLSRTNSAYASELAKVAEKLGLPEDYIDEINTWV